MSIYLSLEEMKSIILLWLAFFLMFSLLKWELKKTLKYSTLLVFILATSINLHLSIVHNKNIRLFSMSEKLKCDVENMSYLVDKDSSWGIIDEYFVKDSILIRPSRCKRWK